MEIIEKYFPTLTSIQKERYLRLEELYKQWNKKINVISRKDIDQLYLRHVLHSLSIARYIQFKGGTHVLDVGTGGGFPGIPLAILFPGIHFMLVDSIRKKINVVESICRELQLDNCNASCIRAEDLRGSYDFIVCRAVTSLPEFINRTAHLLSRDSKNSLPNGILALKGGDLNNELNIRLNYRIVELDTYFKESFFKTKKLVHVFF